MLSPSEKEWIGAFAAEVEAGNSGKTTELVNALRRLSDTPASVAREWAVNLEGLQRELAQEASPAARNRLLRRWLAGRASRVHEVWLQLGFPSPSAVSCCKGATGSMSRRGVAVFDFDMTLTTRHVSAFEDVSDVEQVSTRIFGGAARVQMLQEMLDMLSAKRVMITIVSRNARFVILKVLQAVGFDRSISPEHVFGFEQFDDDTPKSAVVRERILPAVGLAEASAIFIDDDQQNIKDMQTACPDTTVLIAPRGGITQEQVATIAAWAKAIAAHSGQYE